MSVYKQSTSFFSGPYRLAAHLYIPQQELGKLPAIVLVAPQAGVKEQTVANYAEKLAQKGFITLTFDHASFGASEGEPRFHENPYRKAEDISHAVTFLRMHPQVDADNIHGVGVCSGGGYLAYTAVTDRRIKSVSTVSAYFDHRGFYHSVMGREGVLTLLEQVNKAREDYLRTGMINYLPHAPEQDSEEMPALFREFYDYYMTPRGQKGLYQSRFLPWSYESLCRFSALDVAAQLTPTPLLMIVGSEAGSAYESKQMYQAAAEPKNLIQINHANHVDLYDVEQYVNSATNEIFHFIKNNI
ncbi:TPA: alpha/beta hydrolase [Vibrio cholerae]